MIFEEWAKNSKWNFDSSEYAKEIKAIAKAAFEAGREAETVGLRDQIAIAYMQAQVQAGGLYETWGDLSGDAYKVADAMLKERMK